MRKKNNINMTDRDELLKKCIKFKKNKASRDLNMPQYTISYATKDAHTDSSNASLFSYKIISALKGSNGVVLEVNSSMFSISNSERDKIAFDFLKAIRYLGIDFSYHKVSSPSKSFVSLIRGKKEEETHEILAYIPDEVWKKQEFFDIIPKFGVRYYITKDNEEDDGKKLIENMNNYLDEEKLEKFKLIIFDVVTFSQMGLISNSLSADEIRNLVNLG